MAKAVLYRAKFHPGTNGMALDELQPTIKAAHEYARYNLLKGDRYSVWEVHTVDLPIRELACALLRRSGWEASETFVVNEVVRQVRRKMVARA